MPRLNYRLIILGTSFILLFFNSGTRYAFGLMLKPMANDLEWSRSELSLALSTFMLVSALAMPLIGRLVDRYSLRLILATGVFLGAVGIGLTGHIQNQWQLFVVYGFIYAIGHAATAISTVSVLIARWFSNRQGLANSIAISGNGIGQLIIVTLLASFLSSIDWRTSYTILGIANFVIVIPLVLVTIRDKTPSCSSRFIGSNKTAIDQPAQHATGGRVQGSVQLIFKSKQLWILLLVYAICGFQDFFVATHVVAFALDLGLAYRVAGHILAFMGVLGIMGVLISGAVSDKFGPARPVFLCFLIRLPIFAFIMLEQNTTTIVIFAFLYGFTFLMTAPLAVIFSAKLFGSQRLGMINGLISSVHQISGGLGAFVGAMIFDLWNTYNGAFLLMTVLSSIGLISAITLHKGMNPSTSIKSTSR